MSGLRINPKALLLQAVLVAFSACTDPAGPPGWAMDAAEPAFSHTPAPGAVTVAGSFQSELGCPSDWMPGCPLTDLSYDAVDGVWQASFDLPAGNWEYKVALNGGWTENYGAGGVLNGSNIALAFAAPTTVKFYYDHETHWVTDDQNSVIATVPGSFQSELGCPGDWAPDCLRSWLQDPDGDGSYVFSAILPAGSYEAKVAIDESWDEHYGAGGVPGGSNIPFTVLLPNSLVTFTYDAVTHVLTITQAPPPTGSVTLVGSLQSELGCPGDWQPDCAATHFGLDPDDAIWQVTFDVPAGSWEYKAALNDSWDINYGAGGVQNGANIPLVLAAPTFVKFYYDDVTHWVTDNQNSVIVTVPGNFQSELGCPGDWAPECLRSWLQDPDGDGTYDFTTDALPAGNYEAKAAIDESWDINYGAGGVQNGANIPFSVPAPGDIVMFSYDEATHILTITVPSANQPPVADAGGPYTVDEGSTVTFDGAASWDPDGDALTYEWDFDDDGLTDATGPAPSHTFPEGPASVVVSLTVSDGQETSTVDAVVNVVNVAPAVGAITGPTDPVPAGATANVSAPYSDPGNLDIHTVEVDWGDGTASAGTAAAGTAGADHIYAEAGVYTVQLTVTDDDGGADTSVFEYVVVYDPGSGFVTGGGWIESPPGAWVPDPALTGMATFGFTAKYVPGASQPKGHTQFQFHVADLNFSSTAYQWLVVAGPKAQFKGWGTINGEGDYGFMLTAIDGARPGGGGADRLRMKIWDRASGDVIYDTQLGDTDNQAPATIITRGSIVIHS